MIISPCSSRKIITEGMVGEGGVSRSCGWSAVVLAVAGVTENPAAWSRDGEGAELDRVECCVRWLS